jgi:hypothetical protein
VPCAIEVPLRPPPAFAQVLLGVLFGSAACSKSCDERALEEIAEALEDGSLHSRRRSAAALGEACPKKASRPIRSTLWVVLSREQIRRNYEAGLEQGRRYFMGDADIQRAARHLARTLGEMGIDYAICGALAVMAHGHARFTEDVDVLMTPDGLRRFKDRWLGQGWVERFPGSKGVRDVVHKVNIDVLLTGQYPGDGKPKPVRFPDPTTAAIDLGHTKTITLPTLIELKLASGMTAPDRPRDLDDVIQLVRANSLPREFVDELDPWVRDKFEELWGYAQLPIDEEP